MDLRWDGGYILNILPAGKQTARRDASPAAGRGLGMFTRRCRLLRPQPETERRDHQLFGGNRVLVNSVNRPPIPPQRPFAPILNYFIKRSTKPTPDPYVGLETITGGFISSVDIHVHFTASPRSSECGTHRTKVLKEL